MTRIWSSRFTVALAFTTAVPLAALADDASPPPLTTEAAAPEQPPLAPPPPYSLPWQLRPIRAGTVIRLDNVLATSDDQGASAVTDVTILTVSYKATPSLAPMVRLGFVVNDPASGDLQTSLTNAVVGASYAVRLDGGFTVTPFLGLALPIATGGGNEPDAAAAAANRAGIAARSAMDNAMFAANDLTVIPGIGAAYVRHDLTVQVEATVLELIRVRGADVQADSMKTNMTTAVHVGYFVLPRLSLGAELRYQRFLSTPAAIKADMTGKLRDTLTMAAGLRAHFKAGKTWLRPGIAYARALDDPLAARNQHAIHIDVPVALP